MGVNKLNTLLINASNYTGKFKTIIIDGSNMIITLLSAVIGGLKKKHYHFEWNVFNLDMIQMFYEIISQTEKSVNNTLNKLQGYLIKGGQIIFTIDSYIEPNYITFDREVLNVKSGEHEARKQKQDRTDAINKQIEVLRLQYAEYNEDNIWVNEKILIEIFKQLDYFNNAGNYLALTNIIIQTIILKNEDICFIRANSEADFVIRNIAFTFQDEPVLVMSRDTDYFILLSDITNVYKTDISLGEPIYYPYEFWRETFNEDITYEKLSYVATLIGNDYVSHDTYLTMDAKDGVKNINRILGILNINNKYGTEIAKSRMRKIKKITQDFYPEEETTVEDFELIFDNLEENYNNAIKIYKSWNYNLDFTILTSDVNTRETLILNMLQKYQKEFENIYRFEDLKECILTTFEKKESTYNFIKIDNIEEYYKKIVAETDGIYLNEE